MNPTRSLSDFRGVLAEPAAAFLTHKRALGRRYSTEEKVLHLFEHYLDVQHIEVIDGITPAVLDAFLASRPRHSAQSYNHLLGVLRRFFDWLVVQQMIPHSPLNSRPRRTTAQHSPFIFDVDQARLLLEVAARLPSRPDAPNRGATYRAIFALLYALGLRVGEVSRLCVQDIDPQRNLLVIRQTKFSKTRLVPFGPHIGAVLSDHLHQSQVRLGVLSPEQPVFSFSQDGGRPINPNTISWNFHRLLPELQLTVPPGVAPPHLHCLRHSFAVGTLLRWYREGVDPARRLIHLATFMGHVSPSSTAYYLTITAQLLESANARFERFAAPVLEEARL